MNPLKSSQMCFRCLGSNSGTWRAHRKWAPNGISFNLAPRVFFGLPQPFGCQFRLLLLRSRCLTSFTKYWQSPFQLQPRSPSSYPNDTWHHVLGQSSSIKFRARRNISSSQDIQLAFPVNGLPPSTWAKEDFTLGWDWLRCGAWICCVLLYINLGWTSCIIKFHP
jgi:hypothetical protein